MNDESQIRAEVKRMLINRLDHIRRLAKQKNYAEIDRLLRESYV